LHETLMPLELRLTGDSFAVELAVQIPLEVAIDCIPELLGILPSATPSPPETPLDVMAAPKKTRQLMPDAVTRAPPPPGLLNWVLDTEPTPADSRYRSDERETSVLSVKPTDVEPGDALPTVVSEARPRGKAKAKGRVKVAPPKSEPALEATDVQLAEDTGRYQASSSSATAEPDRELGRDTQNGRPSSGQSRAEEEVVAAPPAPEKADTPPTATSNAALPKPALEELPAETTAESEEPPAEGQVAVSTGPGARIPATDDRIATVLDAANQHAHPANEAGGTVLAPAGTQRKSATATASAERPVKPAKKVGWSLPAPAGQEADLAPSEPSAQKPKPSADPCAEMPSPARGVPRTSADTHAAAEKWQDAMRNAARFLSARSARVWLRMEGLGLPRGVARQADIGFGLCGPDGMKRASLAECVTYDELTALLDGVAISDQSGWSVREMGCSLFAHGPTSTLSLVEGTTSGLNPAEAAARKAVLFRKAVPPAAAQQWQKLARAPGVSRLVTATLKHGLAHVGLLYTLPGEALAIDLAVGAERIFDAVTVERLRQTISGAGGAAKITAVECWANDPAVVSLAVSSVTSGHTSRV